MSSNTSREYREGIAARVRKARNDRGLTEKQVAGLLGITQPTYSKYEGRLNDPATIMPTY